MGNDESNPEVLRIFNHAFSGHISKDARIVSRYEPGELSPKSRAIITILLDENYPNSRCGVVDLLHPSENDTPRCADENCRCMLKARKDGGK